MRLPTLSPSPDKSPPSSGTSATPEPASTRPGRRTRRAASERAGPVKLDTWAPRGESKVDVAKPRVKPRIVDDAAIAQLAKPKVEPKTLPGPTTKPQAATKLVDAQALAMLAKPKSRTQVPAHVEEKTKSKPKLKLQKRKRRSTSKTRERLLAAAAAAKVCASSDEQSLQRAKGSDQSRDSLHLCATTTDQIAEQSPVEGNPANPKIQRAKEVQQLQQPQPTRRSQLLKHGRLQESHKKQADVRNAVAQEVSRFSSIFK